MDLPKSFYLGPTAEQIEEYIEFIDWSLMPINRIPKETKEKFSDVKQLQLIIWMQEIFDTYEIKENKITFPDSLFFFKDRICYIELDKKGIIRLSYDGILNIIDNTFTFDLVNIACPIIANLVNHHFGNESTLVDVLFDSRKITINNFFYPSS